VTDTEQIAQLLEAPIEKAGYELWDLEYRREGSNWVLRLFIDHPRGVTLDDCVAVNHIVNPILEAHDLILQKYTLEVSSPGIYCSLKKADHFKRFVRETIQITLYQAVSNRKKLTGQLVSATTKGFEILLENGERLQLAYQQVAKARIK
jgi:ribosome maturation factor RimP